MFVNLGDTLGHVGKFDRWTGMAALISFWSHALAAALYQEMLHHDGKEVGRRHARKHLKWALDVAAETAGLACGSFHRFRGEVLILEDPGLVTRRLADAYSALSTSTTSAKAAA